jgi:hypothetical protein
MMKKILLLALVLIAILIGALFVVGPMNAMINILKPGQAFEEQVPVEAPDYSKEKFWAALPGKEDLSDMKPEGVAADSIVSDVNVFFIHPTGFLKNSSWNSSMDATSATEENTKWMMANQASVFSDANVYAPRYREATIYSFFELDNPESNGNKALDLAYLDVLESFDYFIDNYNGNAPFILASHSQGSLHGMRLIEEKIDNSPLADQLIAAYLIGMGTISDKRANALKNIKVCDSPTQTGCIIHWATYRAGSAKDDFNPDKMVCVNPLNWRRDGEKEVKEKNLGFVHQSGEYNLKFYGDDEDYEPTQFETLQAPVKAHTFAYCEDGRLLVDDQGKDTEFLGDGNYHGLDYLLFHMDIRANLVDRVKAYKGSKDWVVSD